MFAAVLHMEGCEPIGADLAALDVFYAGGLRSLGPVWSRNNIFAHGVPFAYPMDPDTGPGLTREGEELVKACNNLGILVDLAHITEKGFWDVARISDRPLVASHSNVHALTPVARDRDRSAAGCHPREQGARRAQLRGSRCCARMPAPRTLTRQLTDMVRHVDYLVEPRRASTAWRSAPISTARPFRTKSATQAGNQKL